MMRDSDLPTHFENDIARHNRIAEHLGRAEIELLYALAELDASPEALDLRSAVLCAFDHARELRELARGGGLHGAAPDLPNEADGGRPC
jgi:hypothetical protein